jgi:hypothetical protein
MNFLMLDGSRSNDLTRTKSTVSIQILVAKTILCSKEPGLPGEMADSETEQGMS